MSRERDAQVRALDALRAVARCLPQLAARAYRARVIADPGVPSASVDDSGLVRVSPAFVATLSTAELEFVMAHELMHLALRTHERARAHRPALFNVAHDLVINDMLAVALRCEVPRGGVRLAGARFTCAERLLRNADVELSSSAFLAGDATGSERESAEAGTRSTDSQLRLGGLGRRLRVARWSPSRVHTGHRISAIFRAGWVHLHPELSEMARVAGTVPAGRSWARLGRRAHSLGVAIPARLAAEARAPVFVLDTSTSMFKVLEDALGMIRALASELVLGTVRIVQCAGEVTDDREHSIEMLQGLAVEGLPDDEMHVEPNECRGCRAHHAAVLPGAPPTRLDAALQRLASEGVEGSVVVVTDGNVESSVLFDGPLVWALTGDAAGFSPASGVVVRAPR